MFEKTVDIRGPRKGIPHATQHCRIVLVGQYVHDIRFFHSFLFLVTAFGDISYGISNFQDFQETVGIQAACKTRVKPAFVHELSLKVYLYQFNTENVKVLMIFSEIFMIATIP
jgi:hypothetical protein